jgi:tetratricopeptide (TPR) repeat protein
MNVLMIRANREWYENNPAIYTFFLTIVLAVILLISFSSVNAIPSDPSVNAMPSTYGFFPVLKKEEAALIDLSGRKGAKKFTGINKLINTGDYDAVIKVATTALKKFPDSGLGHEILGTAYYLDGQQDRAIVSLKKAIKLEPGQSGAITKLGVVYMESGKLEQAEKLLLKAVDINSGYRFAHQRLGMLYEYQKKYQTAVRHYQLGLIGVSDSYIGVAVNLARLLNKFGNYSAALTVLESRVPISSTSVEGQLTVASSYLAIEEYSQARKRFERVLQLDSTKLEALLGRARAQRGEGELKAAQDSINMLIKLKPEYADAKLEKGEILLRLDQKASANIAFDSAVSLGASRNSVNQRIAKFHLDRKEFVQARDIYQAMVNNGTADVVVYSKLSELLMAQGDIEKGEQVLRNGAKKFPDNAYLYLRHGSYLASVGEYEKSLPIFKKSIELAPDDATVWKAYAIALLRTDKKNEAAKAASQMVRLQPGNVESAIFYATRLEATLQTDKAEAIYRKVIKAVPDHALALNNLANLLSGKKKYTEAEVMAKRASSVVSDNGNIQDTLGWIIYRQGRLNEALKVLSKASKLSPEVAVIWYHKGVVLADLNQKTEAKAAFEKALSLNKKAEDWVADAKSWLQKR